MGGMHLVFLGLSLSSSWGNGHATTYRALLNALARRGHDILFLERERSWYADNRDLRRPGFCRLVLYPDLRSLRAHRAEIAAADAVIVGSYVPDGIEAGRWVQRVAQGVKAFYDIDTPVTLAQLERGDCSYLSRDLVPGYDLYLSFTGGPTLRRLARQFGAPVARALYCSVDPERHRPAVREARYDLGYIGTYSPDRQPALERLLIEPARRAPDLRFVVAGPQYPDGIRWPENVERIEHVPARQHAAFYGACRFNLNITRADMKRAGYSPSIRLFEAGACAAPVISDRWRGIEEFFEPGREILLADGTEEVLAILRGWGEERRSALARAARRRTLREHSAATRALQLEELLQTMSRRPAAARRAPLPASYGRDAFRAGSPS